MNKKIKRHQSLKIPIDKISKMGSTLKSLNLSSQKSKKYQNQEKYVNKQKTYSKIANNSLGMSALKSNLKISNKQRKQKVKQSTKMRNKYNNQEKQNRTNIENTENIRISNRQLIKKKLEGYLNIEADKKMNKIPIYQVEDQNEKLKNIYFQTVKQIYGALSQIIYRKNTFNENLLINKFGEQIYYFFGNLFHKIKQKKMMLDYKNFMEHATQLFRRSNKQDILSLLKNKLSNETKKKQSKIYSKQEIKAIMLKQNYEYHMRTKKLSEQLVDQPFLPKQYEQLRNNFNDKKIIRKDFYHYNKNIIIQEQDKLQKLNNKLQDYIRKFDLRSKLDQNLI